MSGKLYDLEKDDIVFIVKNDTLSTFYGKVRSIAEVGDMDNHRSFVIDRIDGITGKIDTDFKNDGERCYLVCVNENNTTFEGYNCNFFASRIDSIIYRENEMVRTVSETEKELRKFLEPAFKKLNYEKADYLKVILKDVIDEL